MRCKRCHAVIAEGRKTCPNCGTLIRKKRGNITLSTQSGVQVNRFADGISDGLYNLKVAIRRDNRILIMLVALPLVILGIVLLLSCGVSSCSCTSSCGNEKTSKVKYEARENSREPSNQFAVGDTLYYISDGSIMSRSEEKYKYIYDSISASDLQSDGEYLYFREGNLVKRIELGLGRVSGSDIAETVLDYSTDTNYTLGYFLADGEIYYYLRENESALTTLYSDETLKSGELSGIGYMKGRIYYTVSDSDSTYSLNSVKTDGTDDKVTVSGIINYQLGGGYIYAIIRNAEGVKMLARYDKNGELDMEWDITSLTGGEITSIAANDTWLCFVTVTDSGSVVYRIEHDSNDIASVFAYSDTIELTGVSGDWYAFESITITDDVETRTYSIRNSKNGKSAL